MSTRRHRIFIIGAGQPPNTSAKIKQKKLKTTANLPQIKEQVGQNNQPSRRKMFEPVRQYKRSVSCDPTKSNKLYSYQLEPHIKIEPFGTLLTCDMFNSQIEQDSNDKRRTAVQTRKVQTKQTELELKTSNNAQPSKSANEMQQAKIQVHNESFHSLTENSFSYGLRRKIFQQSDVDNMKKRCHSILTSPRKNIFMELHSDTKLQSSCSKQRKRIFSHDSKNICLTPVKQKKEDQEYSRILPQQIMEVEERDAQKQQSKIAVNANISKLEKELQ